MRRVVPLLLLVAAAAACSGPAPERPRAMPPATPSTAPAPVTEPVGQVVRLDGAPRGIVAAVDGRTVAIAMSGPDRLDVRSLPGLEVVRSVGLPAPPTGLAAGVGDELLVPTEDGLVVVDGGVEASVEGSVEVAGGSRAAAAVGAYRVVVGDRVTALEGLRTTGTDGERTTPFAVAALGDGQAAVVDASALTLTVYALPRLDVVATVLVGEGPTGVVALPDERLAVVDTRGQAVLLLDTGPLFLRQRLPVRGGPYAAALDVSTATFWVTLSGASEAVGYEIRSGVLREVERVATVRQPELVTAAAGRVVVASPRTRELQVVSPEGR